MYYVIYFVCDADDVMCSIQIIRVDLASLKTTVQRSNVLYYMYKTAIKVAAIRRPAQKSSDGSACLNRDVRLIIHVTSICVAREMSKLLKDHTGR